MNSLVLFNVQLWPAHHAECIEVVEQLAERGDRVYILACYGDLASCAANASHSESLCMYCRQTTDNTLKVLGESVSNIIKIDFSKHPDSAYNALKDKLRTSINFSDIASLYHSDTPVGLLAMSQMFDNLSDCYAPLEEDIKSKITTLVINAARLYEFTEQVIHDNSIDEVYAWNGRRDSDGPSLYAAKKLGRKYFSFICGGTPRTIQIHNSTGIHDHRSCVKQVQELATNTKRVFGEKTFNKLALEVARDYKKGISTAENQTSWLDLIGRRSQVKLDSLNIDPTKETIMLLTSSYSEIVYLDGVFGDLGADPYRKMIDCVDGIRLSQKYNILVRWHPLHKVAGPWEREAISRLINDTPYLKHIEPTSDIDTYSLLPLSRYVVSYISSVNLWAALTGIEVLSFGIGSEYYGSNLNRSFDNPEAIKEFLEQEECGRLPFDYEASRQASLEYYYWRRFSGKPMRYIHTVPNHQRPGINWYFYKNDSFAPVTPYQ